MKILINSLQPFLSVWCWRDATSTCTWLMGEDSPSWWTVSVAAQRMKLNSLIRDWRSWMPAAVYWFCKGTVFQQLQCCELSTPPSAWDWSLHPSCARYNLFDQSSQWERSCSPTPPTSREPEKHSLRNTSEYQLHTRTDESITRDDKRNAKLKTEYLWKVHTHYKTIISKIFFLYLPWKYSN